LKSAKKRVLLALLPTVLIIAPLCLGMVLGYGFANKEIREDFRAVAKSETRLAMLKPAEKVQFAKAYDDPQSAVTAMDDYSYNVATVMAPFVGITPDPGQHHNAYINSLQCRSDKEIALPKPPGTFRVFIIGGSAAFGSGASSQDKTISGYLSSILEKELSAETKLNYEVFTLATPSWASTQERIVIENRVLDLQPDLVISFSGNNDVHWGMLGRNVLWFRTYQEEFNWHVLNWAYEEFRKQPMTDVVPVESHPVAPSLVAERLERNVRMSAFALSVTNVRYVFCLQPTLAMTKKPLDPAEQHNLFNLSTIDHTITGSNYFAQCYSLIDLQLSTIKTDNFFYVNLSDVFDSIKTPDRLFLDCYHFGDKGNAIIARCLYDRLKKLLASSQLSSIGAGFAEAGTAGK
jgi:hypothetical protein